MSRLARQEEHQHIVAQGPSGARARLEEEDWRYLEASRGGVSGSGYNREIEFRSDLW